MNNQISLRIHSMKCVDETGGKWAEKVGNDEIDLAGFGIDSNTTTVKIDRLEVYPHFDDGDIKQFSPPRTLVTLSLTGASAFPKRCTVGLLLAERDNGDFGTKSGQVYTKVKEEMDKKKKEEEDKKRNAHGAGNSSLTGAEIAVIWAVVKPLVYDWIKNKIIAAANDDIFPPRDTSVTIPSNDFTWNGSRTSPPTAIEFRGHDGVYLMTYDWELS